MAFTIEGDHVVLTKREDINVTYNNHLQVIIIKHWYYVTLSLLLSLLSYLPHCGFHWKWLHSQVLIKIVTIISLSFPSLLPTLHIHNSKIIINFEYISLPLFPSSRCIITLKWLLISLSEKHQCLCHSEGCFQ